MALDFEDGGKKRKEMETEGDNIRGTDGDGKNKRRMILEGIPALISARGVDGPSCRKS